MTTDVRNSGIVTPEAVVLEFETAGVGSRGLAKIVDVTIQIVTLLVVVFAVLTAGAGLGGSQGTATAAYIVLLLMAFLILFGYPVLSEILWNGKTVGKAWLGIRVVTREGAPIKFRHAAVRGIIGIVEVYVFTFIAILTTALSKTNQRVGDMAGGTIVIRERSAASSAVAVSFPPPPGMESYVQSLDVSNLTSAQYQVIRSFLMRVFQFTPEARMALGVRLANPVALAMKHDPPPMVSPELFLACAASAYQMRHGGPAAAWATAPVAGYPGQGYPGQGYPGQGYPGQGYPGGGYPGQPYPGQPYPGQPYPGQGYPGQPYPGSVHPGQDRRDSGAGGGSIGWSPPPPAAPVTAPPPGYPRDAPVGPPSGYGPQPVPPTPWTPDDRGRGVG